MFLFEQSQPSSTSIQAKDLRSVWLEALVIAQDLRSTGSRHRCNQQTVSQSSVDDLLLERVPFPEVRRRDTPKIELELTLTRWGALESRVRAFFYCKLVRSLDSGVVDGLKDLLVELTSRCRVERQTKSHEGIGETLHTDTDRPVTHVGVLGFLYWVVVDVNDLVQVASYSLGDGVQLLKVVCAVPDKAGQSDRSQVADSDFIRSRVFNDLGAQV